MKRMVYCLFCVWLAACGHVPQKLSERHEQAVAFNHQGERAFRGGEYPLAIERFEQSLRMNESIENVDGVAISRLNLVKCYQAAGDSLHAYQYADSLIDEKILPYPEKYKAVAALHKSLLRINDNDLEGAEGLILDALRWCAEGCDYKGAMLNVRALIALGRGDAAQATVYGELALKENRDHSITEYANTLRLLGSARLLANEPSVALRYLEAALTQDKQQGMTEKIVRDLSLMADASSLMGEAQKALEYQKRIRRIRNE